MLTKTVIDSNGVSRNYYDSKHYVVYLNTDLVNGSFYVGQKGFTDSNDLSGYWGSNPDMNKKIVSQNKDHYSKEVIYETEDTQDITDKEIYFIKYYKDFFKDTLHCLNRCAYPIFYTGGRKHSEETKQKMREAAIGRKHSDESKKKMSMATRGRKRSEETKQKMRETIKNRSEEVKQRINEKRCGWKHSEEAKKRIGEASKNRSEETKQKMREAAIGRKHSEETKQKIRDAKQNISVETRQKISKAGRGRKFSFETRQKMSQVKKKMSNETKQKIREAAKIREALKKNNLKLEITDVNIINKLQEANIKIIKRK